MPHKEAGPKQIKRITNYGNDYTGDKGRQMLQAISYLNDYIVL